MVMAGEFIDDKVEVFSEPGVIKSISPGFGAAAVTNVKTDTIKSSGNGFFGRAQHIRRTARALHAMHHHKRGTVSPPVLPGAMPQHPSARRDIETAGLGIAIQ